MPPYKKMYLQLFNAITGALALLEAGDADGAAQVLASAQQRGEEAYIEAGEQTQTRSSAASLNNP